MMTCSIDGSLQVWNLKIELEEWETERRDGDSGVWTIALSPNKKKVVKVPRALDEKTGSSDNSISTKP